MCNRRNALGAAVKRDSPLQCADVVGAVRGGHCAGQVGLKQDADGLSNVLVGFGEGLCVWRAANQVEQGLVGKGIKATVYFKVAVQCPGGVGVFAFANK